MISNNTNAIRVNTNVTNPGISSTKMSRHLIRAKPEIFSRGDSIAEGRVNSISVVCM